MGISASRPASGANAGRGDNPHFAEMAARVNDEVKEHNAKSMGIPKQWATGYNTAKFSGRIVGWDGSGASTHRLWLSAESTGGGATDSHTINWHHPTMNESHPYNFNKFFGVNPDRPELSKKWTAVGEFNHATKAMHWQMRPHNPEWDD